MTGVASVEKAFDLLEFLSSAGRSTSLQEATQATGLPKPTVYRLLNSLQKLGYVSRPHGSRQYLVGPRVSRLTGYDPYAALKMAARPYLRRLHEEYNETVNLGVLSGNQVLYLEFLETSRALRFIATPGENDPYFCTALGRAIASNFDDEALERLLGQTTLHRPTPYSVRTKSELRQKIQKARALGFAEEVNEAAEGVACLAINLAFLDFPEAALSMAVPLQRLPARRRSTIIQTLKNLSTLSHVHEH